MASSRALARAARDQFAIMILPWRPGDGLLTRHICAKLENFRIVARRGDGAGIGKKHDFSFKALGGVNGHHPHCIAASFHVALDRIFDASEIVEESRERRRRAAFMLDGQIEKFVDRISGFLAEPRFHVAATAIRAQKSRVKSKRAAARPRTPHRELFGRCRMSRISGGLQRIEKACGPAWRERDEIVIVEPDERRFQHAGERQIVLGQQARTPGRDEIHDGDMLREFKPVGAGRLNVIFL